MRLLHGSNTEILTPDLSKCKEKNDFGKGFYLTPNWKRAWQMGKRSTFLHGGKITVNAFLFYPKIGEEKGLQLKSFKDSQLNGQSSFSRTGKKTDSSMTTILLLDP